MFGSIFRKFAPEDKDLAAEGQWPVAGIEAALKKQFESVDHLGEDDGFSVYGVSDRGVNFIVALIAPVEGRVAELAFLARFSGFPVDDGMVASINRNLHLSVAGMEEGDLYLLAGVQAAGVFREDTFLLLLEAWRRDLMIVLHALSGEPSILHAFPAARLERARQFATNAAPEAYEGEPVKAPDLLKAYLGSGPSLAVCEECGGRGKRGFVARTCEDCLGSGFVTQRPSRAGR